MKISDIQLTKISKDSMTKNDLIRKYLQDNPDITSPQELAEKIIKENPSLWPDASHQTIRTVSGTIVNAKKNPLKREKKEKKVFAPTTVSTEKKSGLEVKDDYIIVNWTTRTVITDLGEFGTMMFSFETHSQIQRMYVYADGNKTAAEVAMNFNFPHSKAVHQYARLHGFSKASVPQTDLEFEDGLTVEDAVQQNIQTIKRKVYKETEKEKWKFIQAAAEKWFEFEHKVVEQLKDYIEELALSKVSIPKLDLTDYSFVRNDYALVLGLSDWHFMKLCYDNKGNQVYNRAIARQKIHTHAEDLITQSLMYGIPQKIYIPVGGNDNLHIDGPQHATTANTPQINATDGIWRIGMKEYLDINIDYINTIAQVAPVEVVCFEGNHDERTTVLIGMFLEKLYEDNPQVKVTTSLYPRLYFQYEKNCLIFTHGHHLGKRLRNEIHKIILGEARQFNIDLNNTDNYLLFTGHDHVGSFQDLNGNVQHFIMPSLAGTDDFWHVGQGYMGRAMESAGYLIFAEEGRKAIVYSSK